nr:SDR family oxidoreductase [Deinobacterium chartae]
MLEGRVAVVTGSTRGLGRAIARLYAEQGAAVVISSRSPDAVGSVVAELQAAGHRASGLKCDVTDPDQVQALGDHALLTFGRLDIWVNNAGLSAPYGPTLSVPYPAFRASVESIVLGTYHGSRVALRHMRHTRGGRLINLLGRGDRRPVPYQNAYAASKAWVRSFTLALAREYRGEVGIYALNPGLVRTDLLLRPQALDGYQERLAPLGTLIAWWARPPEVAAQQALRLAASAAHGRGGLEVQALTPAGMLGGLLRAEMQRLRGRAAARVNPEVQTVRPDHF